MMRLENWYVEFLAGDYNEPPELRVARLVGNIYGHARHHDGKEVQTNLIVGVVGDCVKTKSGSLYELGEPAESLASLCLEGAREHFFAHWPKLED